MHEVLPEFLLGVLLLESEVVMVVEVGYRKQVDLSEV